MATATAQLNNLRQSPRKVRLVADLVRGKRVADATELLRFTTKRAARPLRKLIESAQANAADKKLGEELRVKTITVDAGVTMFRRRPAAQGQAKLIHKRTSRVFVELEEATEAASTEKKKMANAS